MAAWMVLVLAALLTGRSAPFQCGNIRDSGGGGGGGESGARSQCSGSVVGSGWPSLPSLLGASALDLFPHGSEVSGPWRRVKVEEDDLPRAHVFANVSGVDELVGTMAVAVSPSSVQHNSNSWALGTTAFRV